MELVGAHVDQLADNFVHASSRAKSLARAGDDYNFHLVVMRQIRKQPFQFLVRLKRQRIQFVGVM